MNDTGPSAPIALSPSFSPWAPRLARAVFSVDSLVFLIWIALFSLLAYRHAGWRDEYQAWLVAMRTTSWSEFFHAISYERQPPLYYLILRIVGGGLVALGLPFRYGPYAIAWLCTAFTVWLVIFMLKSPRWLRYLLPFTSIFLLEYGLLARSYGVALMLIVLAAYFRQTNRYRIGWLCLALCGSMHLYFMLICGVLVLQDVWSDALARRLRWMDFGLAAVVIAIFTWTLISLRPPPYSRFPAGISVERITPDRILGSIAFGVTGIDAWTGSFSWNRNVWWDTSTWPVVVLFVIMGLQGFPVFSFLAAAAAPIAIITGLYYPISYRYTATVFCALLYLALKKPSTIQKRFPAFAVLLIAMTFTSYRWIRTARPWESFQIPFSGADEVIFSLGDRLSTSIILTDKSTEPIAYSLAGRFAEPLRIYSIYQGGFIQYPYFLRRRDVSMDQWCHDNRKSLTEKFGDTPILLLTNQGWQFPRECGPARLLVQNSQGSFSGENYVVSELVR